MNEMFYLSLGYHIKISLTTFPLSVSAILCQHSWTMESTAMQHGPWIHTSANGPKDLLQEEVLVMLERLKVPQTSVHIFPKFPTKILQSNVP